MKFNDKISYIICISIGFIKFLNSIRLVIIIFDYLCCYFLVFLCIMLILEFMFFSIVIYKYFLFILEIVFFLLNDLLVDMNVEFVVWSLVMLLLFINMVIFLEIFVLVLWNMYEMERNFFSCYENF